LAPKRQAQLIGQLTGLDCSDAPALRGLALAAVLAWLGGPCRQVQPTGDVEGSGTLVLCSCWLSKTCTGPTRHRSTCCST